jgi:hypothetical protein
MAELADDESRRQHMHQLHHQQACQQGRYQTQVEDQQQAGGHHQPGGNFVTGYRHIHRMAHGCHSAKKPANRQELKCELAAGA